MASLKERMAMLTKSAAKTDDHQEFKKKSGNTEQPEKVGKLTHSYLSRDSGAKPKRNFKVPKFNKKKKEEGEKKAEEATTTTSTAAATTESKDEVKTAAKPKQAADAPKSPMAPKSPIKIPGRLSGKFKNPFLRNDMAGKVNKKGKEGEEGAAKPEKSEKEADDDELEAQEEEDDFVIPEDEEGEEGDEVGDMNKQEAPKRGALRNFVQTSQRLSLGIFAKKKGAPTSRTQSDTSGGRKFGTANISAADSKARDRAGIKLNDGNAAPPPRKRISLLGNLGRMGSKRNTNNNKMNAYNLVLDKARADEVEGYLDQINTFKQSFTLVKRLSIRDNDIVQAVQRVIDNDPKQTAIKITDDVRFGHLRSSLVQDFGDAIRKNLYLKTLTIKGVDLGNPFLEALASAIRDNVTLQEIDLSRNAFTHDALVEFCQALELNHTITKVKLETQLSPLYEKGAETALAAIENNRSVKSMTIDFQGDVDGKFDKRLKEITQRNYWNKDNYPMPNPDDLLVNFLKEEVVRTEELHQQKMLEKDLEEVREGDWDYLYELAVLFDRFKIQETDEESKRSSVQSYASPMHAAQQSRNSEGFGAGKNPMTGAQGFPSDGSFLTEEFIDTYLQEDAERGGLVFNFCNQARLFKQFPSTSPDRETIVNIFVYELLHHPRQQEFTGINMTNTGCGNDFWVKIAEGVLEDPDLFPNINMISAETNFLTEAGFVAIADMVKSETSMRYLQVLKLDNQKALLSSKAERALARAMCVNLSIVRFSLRVRNLLERDQCNKYVVRNIDFLRQARRHHKINTGTLEERKRNAMEQLFDSIAANDESITEVNISADIKFTGLSDVEKVKSAKAFATNSHVKKVLMNQLQLGDKFAIALGEALERNKTIERLVIEGNAFTGAGFKGIFEGLGKNSSVVELLAGHQTKAMSSPDEQALPGLLQGNETITKISLDLRNSAVTMQLDKICNQNRSKRISAQRPSERKRNAMEQYFDSIAANDESITEVNLSADVKFTGLSKTEKVKSAKAFATNSHVTKVTMNQLQLGDDFLIALGEALETNTTIERLVIEGNSFAGPGFKGLFTGLGKNSSVKELLGKHQTKSMSSSDEQVLPALIEENTTLSKISLDLRNSAVTMALDKVCNRNNQERRKKKNSSAVSGPATDNAAMAVASTPAGSLRDSVVPVPTDEPQSEATAKEKSEEKPFDEDKPPSESPVDEAPVDKVPEKKQASNEKPFDERSVDDKPFDEEMPEDEVSPVEKSPVDEEMPEDEASPVEEAPADEEMPEDEDAPADEGPATEQKEDNEDAPADEVPETEQKEDDDDAPADEIHETEQNEDDEDAPADEGPETETKAEIEVVAEEEAPVTKDAPAAEEEAPADENEPAPQMDVVQDAPAAEQVENEAKEAVEEAPADEAVSEPEVSAEEAPADEVEPQAAEDAPAEEPEPEPKTPEEPLTEAAPTPDTPDKEEEEEVVITEAPAAPAEDPEPEPKTTEELSVEAAAKEEEPVPKTPEELSAEAPAEEEVLEPEPKTPEEPLTEAAPTPDTPDEEEEEVITEEPAASAEEPEPEPKTAEEEEEELPEPEPTTTEELPVGAAAEEEEEPSHKTPAEAAAEEEGEKEAPKPEPKASEELSTEAAEEEEEVSEPEPLAEAAEEEEEEEAEPVPEPEPQNPEELSAEAAAEAEPEPKTSEELSAEADSTPGTPGVEPVPVPVPEREPKTPEEQEPAKAEPTPDLPAETPAKEATPVSDTVIEVGDGEEIEVSHSGEIAEEEEHETNVEEIDGKSAESWD